MPTKSALSGARRAKVTGFGVPEHHRDGLALPRLVRSGNLNLEIWSSGVGLIFYSVLAGPRIEVRSEHRL